MLHIFFEVCLLEESCLSSEDMTMLFLCSATSYWSLTLLICKLTDKWDINEVLIFIWGENLFRRVSSLTVNSYCSTADQFKHFCFSSLFHQAAHSSHEIDLCYVIDPLGPGSNVHSIQHDNGFSHLKTSILFPCPITATISAEIIYRECTPLWIETCISYYHRMFNDSLW
jgi:hypothetical protein